MNEVDICNLALALLDAGPISTLDTPVTEEEKKCSALYEPTRQALLRSVHWKFAQREQTLAEASGATSVLYDCVYIYPSNCIRVKEIFNSVAGADPIEYEVRAGAALNSREIITNEADAVLIYTADIAVVNMFSADFIDVFKYRLAADLAPGVTGDEKQHDRWFAKFAQLLSFAQTTDAREQKRKSRKPTNQYLSARK